ncbi:MAG: alpha/beta hydrolase [Lactobacillus sp.]|nr:alpha/beta hydrolase [Lactobacillus sp.]
MNLTVNGVNLYYSKIGFGHPLILLHGHHMDGGIFDKIVAPLSVYYTVYVIDMRGHGLSSGEPAEHYQDEADDVKEFIKQLGLKDPFVYGFDAGGLIALLLASQNPDLIKKLIICGVFVSGDGVKPYHYLTEGALRLFTRDLDSQVQLTETFITPSILKKIKTPTLACVGEKDWVKVEHVRNYAKLMQNCRLVIMPRQTHTSYTVNSFKMLDLIKEFCKE